MSVEQRATEEQFGKRAASGVLWLAAQKWAVRATGFATLIVLTRQVSPRDFGVIAAAMTVIPMVYLLSDLGFSTYLLQTDEMRDLLVAVAAGIVVCSYLYSIAPRKNGRVSATPFGLDTLGPIGVFAAVALVAGPNDPADEPLYEDC